MSTEIEFDRRAYKTEIETEFGTDDYYLIVGLFGSNNLRNLDGTISKEWVLLEFGRWGKVLKRIIDLSKDTEGNVLRYQNGSTKPENYIKNWRKTLKDAGTFGEFKNRFWDRIAYYTIEDNKQRLNKKQVEYLKERGWEKDTFNGVSERTVIKKSIDTPNSLRQIEETYGYNGKMDNRPNLKIEG